jgi:2'-5' RNA ligase
MEQIRSFIAVELPEEIKTRLEQLEAQLKSETQTRVKWVDPNSIHLTLKFLGNIDAGRTGEIIGAMEEAVKGIPPFRLAVKELGVFPNVRRVQVAWVGLSGEVDKLRQVQQRLESNLEQLGFAAESRAFTPHLTIARIRNQASPDERQKFGQLITGTSFDAGEISVDAISLMRSQLTRQGAIYSRLGSAGLTDLT